eukprot:TRINITY_DN689_c1_g1_i1.p1 TRINITY_DN689_c1_g1~~TRINITY_DN689_c1_g1_i1.p1  ORF type:complete len:141 (-),score=1.06 TRINITY_DN689_c1_g1_i1:35-457(-)
MRFFSCVVSWSSSADGAVLALRLFCVLDQQLTPCSQRHCAPLGCFQLLQNVHLLRTCIAISQVVITIQQAFDVLVSSQIAPRRKSRVVKGTDGSFHSAIYVWQRYVSLQVTGMPLHAPKAALVHSLVSSPVDWTGGERSY